MCSGVLAHTSCAACAPAYAASTSSFVQAALPAGPGVRRAGRAQAANAAGCGCLEASARPAPASRLRAALHTARSRQLRTLHAVGDAALGRVGDAGVRAGGRHAPLAVLQHFVGARRGIQDLVVERHGACTPGSAARLEELYRICPLGVTAPEAVMSARVDLAVDCHSVLGESPIWCGRSKRLYWVDINGRTVSTYEPAAQQMPCLPVPMPALVGTIVPRAGGNLLACLEEDIVPVNPDTRVVGLPLAAVPLEHRARPARTQRARARCLRAAVLACGRLAQRALPVLLRLLRLAASRRRAQAVRECASTTASAIRKGGCGSERCTHRACPVRRRECVVAPCASRRR